ncbi:MAG: cupin domain-containing protein [Alphaproteobacteria bacterium]|nr:cupin domain-containing protein [Alphaproteobacteria bacterium SS10]
MKLDTTEVELRSTAATYIASLSHTLNDLVAEHPWLASFTKQLTSIDAGAPIRGPFNAIADKAHQHLEQIAGSLPHTGTTLADAVNSAIHNLDWSPVYGGGGVDQRLADGLFTAQAAGNYGGFNSDHISAGLFLLAPHLRYPLHTHEAEEVYYCISGEVDIQHGYDGAPVTLTPGHHSYTPAHRLHGLTTREQPALLAYSWHGDLRCKTWWWARQADGSLHRTAWHRPEGGSWEPQHEEPVDREMFAQAHEGQEEID